MDGLLAVASTDQPLDVEQGGLRIDGGLVLGRLSNQLLVADESNIRGSNTVTLVVRDDLDLAVLEDTDA